MNLTTIQQIERQNIIEELNELGFHETEGKSFRELSTKLALIKIKVESPHNTWF